MIMIMETVISDGISPSFLISTPAVPPGTRAGRQLDGPGADPNLSAKRRLPKHEYDLISPPDEFSCVGLRHCQRVLML